MSVGDFVCGNGRCPRCLGHHPSGYDCKPEPLGMTSPTQTPSPDVAGLVERLRDDTTQVFGHYAGEADGTLCLAHIADISEAAALIERLTAERDEARAENARWLLRMEAIREASGVGVLPMLSDLPDAIAAKMADHIGEADHMIAPLPELSGNPGGLREKVAEAINRAMIDGQGDQDIIRLATDDILAIPEIAALQAGEGR